MSTIIIDAGHGGYDNGAVYFGRREKDDNLRLARAVRDRLAAQGQKVVMTRDSDVFIPLLERSAISNANNADIFVSLHRNASESPSANGVENWVQVNSPPGTMANAQTVLNRVVGAGVQSNRGVRTGNFSVLRNTVAPAMLLEMGFISNVADNELFDRNFDAYADAITRGILESLGEYAPPPTTTVPNEVIRTIQSTLNARYNTGLNADGIFGSRTRRALVTGLQIELNRLFNARLIVDGLFGPNTKSAVPNLAAGATGYLVWLLQAALYVNGFETDLDGIFGPMTTAQVRAFQRSRGLADDGIAGPNTFEALFN